ncbi:MAG: hypothetical protein C0505_05470 [Leptothrix sp. (in: Bacteria)]|nr:hypothetical protein [Leptothrix sp. (in: b-proteobacteria)]
MRIIVTMSVGALLMGLAGCGEKPQVIGKRSDQAPYATAAGAYRTGDWKQGDAASWERHLNARAQQGQNEYGRTGPH